MKHKTWIAVDNCINVTGEQVTPTKEMKQWFEEQGFQILSYFSKSPLLLLELNQENLNYLKIACPFGTVSVVKKELPNGTYVNAPSYHRTPTSSLDRTVR